MELFCFVFIYFYIYSILGWFCEVIYCALLDGKWIDRGFLYGPYCPIYGIGGLMIAYLLIPLRENAIMVFIAGVLLSSILEYITSFVLEKIFNTKWWDYSNYTFQINGRVCLVNSILFGILGLATMYVLHPNIINLITKIQMNILRILAISLLLLFILDLIYTINAMIDLKKRLVKLKQLRNQLEERINTIKDIELQQNDLETIEKQIADLLKKKRKHEYSIIRAFPHLQSSKYGKQIEELRRELDGREE